MTTNTLIELRLANQQITGSEFTNPVDLVGWMGCIQAQEYASAKWAIGCRIKGKITDTEIEELFNECKILRTHILRPTWHFVLPRDIRWMLQLTAPKIKSFCKGYHQKLGIDHTMLQQSQKIIAKVLGKNKKMTRGELALSLEKEKINTVDNRMPFLLMDAELNGLICSAGRRGKQFTYMLLEERVPGKTAFNREEAIATLTKQYFLSRGPATLPDFAWWSGLNIADARKGIEMNKEFLVRENINKIDYWFSLNQEVVKPKSSTVFILPAFDEYAVAYKDRKEIIDPQLHKEVGYGLNSIIISKGQIVGSWKRIEKKDTVLIETNLFEFIDNKPSAKAIAAVCKRYSEFIEKELL